MHGKRWILSWGLLAILGGLFGRQLEAREPEELLVDPEPTPLVITLKDGTTNTENAPVSDHKSGGVALAQARIVEIRRLEN